MSSRPASGEPLRRIKHALQHWKFTGYVRWDDKDHVADFVSELDRRGYSRQRIAEEMAKFVRAGGTVREQDNPPNHYHRADVWYNVVLPVGERDVFIKFVIEPDEEDEPGILIVSIHWQVA